MASVLYDVQLWLEHADKVRALSRMERDPRTRQQMLAVAAGFERIAGLASMLRSTSSVSRPADRSLVGRIWGSAA